MNRLICLGLLTVMSVAQQVMHVETLPTGKQVVLPEKPYLDRALSPTRRAFLRREDERAFSESLPSQPGASIHRGFVQQQRWEEMLEDVKLLPKVEDVTHVLLEENQVSVIDVDGRIAIFVLSPSVAPWSSDRKGWLPVRRLLPGGGQ